jgi:hypothetical protein
MSIKKLFSLFFIFIYLIIPTIYNKTSKNQDEISVLRENNYINLKEIRNISSEKEQQKVNIFYLFRILKKIYIKTIQY